jgi:DNA processing protein
MSSSIDLDSPIVMAEFLHYLPGCGSGVYHQLLSHLANLEGFFSRPLSELLYLLPKAAHDDVTCFRQQGWSSPVGRQYLGDQKLLTSQNVQRLTYGNADYPPLWAETHTAPSVLYVKGEADILLYPQLAFVGSRQSTPIGEDNAYAFSKYLAERDLVITSGLALGIDSCAHRAALSVGGLTVGVMATGIDAVYPSRNRSLVAEIIKTGGAVVTEFKPRTPARAGHFPRRNRIISGLSLGVLVVEAAIKSGSLITARFALEQNREVFAIPGSIHNPVSKGCHALIKQGATLVECASDIALELQGWCSPSISSMAFSSKQQSLMLESLTEEAAALLAAIDYDMTSTEILHQRLQWPVAKILAGLMPLQIQGLIIVSGGGYQRL